MPVSKFSCPKCGKELKSSAPLPAGKKIKCPACAGIFTIGGKPAPAPIKPGAAPSRPVSEKAGAAPKKTMLARAPLDDDPDGPPPRSKPSRDAIQAKKPAAPVRPAPLRDDDEDDYDRPRRHRGDEDEDESPRRAKSRARHDEEDDYEERPRRRGRRDKDDARSSGGFPWLLVGGGVLVLALSFTMTAFVWPGFMRGGGGGGGGGGGPGANVDLLTFLPANSALVGGINFAPLRNDPTFAKNMQDAVQKLQAQGTPPSLIKAFRDADEIVVSGSTTTGSFVVAVRTVSAIDQAGMLKDSRGTRVAGKNYHRLPEDGRGGGFLAFPAERVLVFGAMLPEPEFERALANGGKQVTLLPDLQQHAQQGNGAVLWGALVVEGELKQQLQGLQAHDLPNVPGVNLQGLAPALRNLRSAHVVMRQQGKSATIQAQLGCGSDQDAAQLSQAGSTLWNGVARPFIGQLPLLFQVQGLKAPPLTNLTNDLNKLSITNQGSSVTVSVTFSEQTMRDLENFDPNQGGFEPGPGFPGPGQFPGPGPFPKGPPRFP